MYRNPRPIPNENSRVRHVARAKVVDHIIYTQGRWWWKQQVPSLIVRFSGEEHIRIARILEAVPTGEFPRLGPTRQEVAVGMQSISERDNYSIGEEVEILFSTSNGVEAYFTGARLFRWDGLRKIDLVLDGTA